MIPSSSRYWGGVLWRMGSRLRSICVSCSQAELLKPKPERRGFVMSPMAVVDTEPSGETCHQHVLEWSCVPLLLHPAPVGPVHLEEPAGCIVNQTVQVQNRAWYFGGKLLGPQRQKFHRVLLVASPCSCRTSLIPCSSSAALSKWRKRRDQEVSMRGRLAPAETHRTSVSEPSLPIGNLPARPFNSCQSVSSLIEGATTRRTDVRSSGRLPR